MDKSEDITPRSLFVPWRRGAGNCIEIFLQKRAASETELPGYIAFFGGKIDKGETPEESLLREVKEELGITPTGYTFYKRIEIPGVLIANIFTMPAGADFENSLTIDKSETQYGRFYSEEDLKEEGPIWEHDRDTLADIFDYLSS